MMWLWALSCATEPAPAPETPSAEPWSWQDTAAGDPTLDAAALQTDLQATLDATGWVRATDPLASFRAVWEYATPDCPYNEVITETEDAGTTLYFDQLCIGGDMIFKGPALLYTWNDDLLEPIAAMAVASHLPPTVHWTGYGFNGQTDVYSQDGSIDFNCSCTMIDAVGTGADGSAWFFGVTQGPAHYTGPEGQGTWMDDPSIDPNITITVNEKDAVREISARGILSGLGERFDAMSWEFQGITMKIDDKWACVDGGMTLDVAYRDSATMRWGTMSLSSAPSCELCGTTETGDSVCVSASPFLDWEGSPWW